MGGIFLENFESDYLCVFGIVSVYVEDLEIIRENFEWFFEVEIWVIKKVLIVVEKLRKFLNVCYVLIVGGIEVIIKKNFFWVSFEVIFYYFFLILKDFERNFLLKVYLLLRSEEY